MQSNLYDLPEAILFDLDGTILDTVPDLIASLNKLRNKYQLKDLAASVIKPIANFGSKAMIKAAFNIEENDPAFKQLREEFLVLYEQHLADSTQFFPNMDKVLDYLDHHAIPWGIVTNKLTQHTLPLLKALKIAERAQCVVCGDTLPTYKPDPAPILYACSLLQKNPQNCIYLGDAKTDVIASKAAGTKAIVALYGYINEEDDPISWEAHEYITEPIELLNFLKL